MKTLTLLRKDLRLYRLPLLCSLVLVVVPYLFVVDQIGFQWERLSAKTLPVREQVGFETQLVEKPNPLQPYAGIIAAGQLVEAALGGIAIAVVTAAAYGGLAFALERRNGTAEFLALLPATRSQIAASKVAAATLCLLVPIAVHVTFICGWYVVARNIPTGDPSQVFRPLLVVLRNCAAVALLLFGVGWLMSVLMPRPVLASVIAAEIAGMTFYVAVQFAWHGQEDVARIASMSDIGQAIVYFMFPTNSGSVFRSVEPFIRQTVLAVGSVAMLAGTIVYLRRVAP